MKLLSAIIFSIFVLLLFAGCKKNNGVIRAVKITAGGYIRAGNELIKVTIK